jgi:hypothetical protein
LKCFSNWLTSSALILLSAHLAAFVSLAHLTRHVANIHPVTMLQLNLLTHNIIAAQLNTLEIRQLVQHNEVKKDVKTVFFPNNLNILHGRIQQELQKIDQRLRAAEATAITAANSAAANTSAVPRSCGSQFTASTSTAVFWSH